MAESGHAAGRLRARAAAAAATLLLALGACGRPGAPPPAVFVDFAAASGLDFVHVNGMSGKLYFVEPVGAGGAFFDYDNDGDLDVYLVQGAGLGPESAAGGGDAAAPRDRLFRNDLLTPEASEVGGRRLAFTDVTADSGIDARGYGMGVAAGDVDNDGWCDLFVTNYGGSQLWRNLGDGSFAEVSAKTGTAGGGWNTSATFVDFDRDGWLDLFVARYVDYRLSMPGNCRAPSGRPDYCGPQGFNGTVDRLLRNRGRGDAAAVAFEDVTAAAGLAGAASSGLGTLSADFDRDGRPDLYVANDLRRNFLWMGRPGGRFQNTALLAGAATRGDGRAEASMGVSAGDVDNDGDEDIFLTHLMSGTNTLYLNDGRGRFADRSTAARLDVASLGFTGFGTAFLDYDNDGWLDLVTANGSVNRIEALLRAGDPFPLGQSNQLFRNLGARGGPPAFVDVTAIAGDSFALLEVSRGLATGDVDNDGDTDVLLVNNHGPARLLINQVGQDKGWLGVRLLTADSGRDALGAVAELAADGRRLLRRVRTGGSYLSANDPRLLFGLGLPRRGTSGSEAARPASLRVEWPSGRVELWDDLVPGRYHVLVEGSGRPVQKAYG